MNKNTKKQNCSKIKKENDEMRRTLKDSFLKVRALRARELREVWLLSFFLPFFLFISVHSTITPSLSTIIVET